MPVRATWTVFCRRCGDWRGEEKSKPEAIAVARRLGFVRMRGTDGSTDWYCRLCATNERAALREE